MNSNLMVFSDRAQFIKRWLPLLISGIVIGGVIGVFLKNYISKTVYTYNVGIEIYHLRPKRMSAREYQALRVSDIENVGQYTELVKSTGILEAVNNRLLSKHGVIINTVDLAQMYSSGLYSKNKTVYISCTSSSKNLARWGLDSMANQVRQSLKWADNSVHVKLFKIDSSSVPKVQRGNTNVLFYAPLSGLFVATLLAIILDFIRSQKGRNNAQKV